MLRSRATLASEEHSRVEVLESRYQAVRACAGARLLQGFGVVCPRTQMELPRNGA